MLTIAPGPAILTPAAMRAAEACAIAAGTPALVLMERAAAAAVRAIRGFAPLGEALILCGPGNNGGDGYGVALGLAAAGVRVRIAADAPPTTEPAAIMAARWTGPVEPLASAAPALLVIDALFGTGLTRPLHPATLAALDRFRTAPAIVALDIPSGIDAATGEAHSPPLAAALTIAFGALKPGHLLGAGRRASGRLVTAEIGLGPLASPLGLVPAPTIVEMPANTHKFARGAVLVIEGALLAGAARLSALAALRAGAGVVTLAGPCGHSPADAIMHRDDAGGRALLADRRLGAIVFGPGLAADDRARDWLALLLAGTTPIVIDAGAIALPRTPSRAPLILTPHDGEFARSFGPVGDDRIAAATGAARAANAVIVLKGSETIIAAPDGRTAINTHAAPWLATAGSGDVLAGIIGALVAQGLAPFDAARAGTWLHGDAGRRGGPGLIADDIPSLLPAVLAAL